MSISLPWIMVIRPIRSMVKRSWWVYAVTGSSIFSKGHKNSRFYSVSKTNYYSQLEVHGGKEHLKISKAVAQSGAVKNIFL